jgi:hypothetical protein
VNDAELVIDAVTPLGVRVVCTSEDWLRITIEKHPPMRGREAEVARALADPDEIRRSQRDPRVLLFHRRDASRWICAVARLGWPSGRLITAYPADKIKRGDVLWTR